MGQMQIHILGIGPVFWPRIEMGSSGYVFRRALPAQSLIAKTITASKYLAQ